MSDANKEFEDAARHFSTCQMAFENQRAMNMPTDPVERQEAMVRYETAKAELFNAQARMDRARRAKYPYLNDMNRT